MSNNKETLNLLESCTHPLQAPNIFQKYTGTSEIAEAMVSTPIECSITCNAKLWIDEHNFILTDQCNEVVNKLPHTPDDFWENQEEQTRHLTGRSLVLGAFGDFQYYHWLLDALPKIGLLKNAGIDIDKIDHFVFREISTDFHRETLQLAGIQSDKIVESISGAKFLCDEVLDIRMSNFVGMTMPRFIPDYLKKTILEKSSDTSSGHKRIYIGRPKKLKRRGVENEDDLVAMLSEYGFQHMEMENFSVKEQAQLFNSAEVIVTPHGGALANMVFCNTGTKIIELFAHHVFSYFYGLANLCDLDYSAVLKYPDQYDRVVDPWIGNSLDDQHITSKERSIPVDLALVESALKGNDLKKCNTSDISKQAA